MITMRNLFQRRASSPAVSTTLALPEMLILPQQAQLEERFTALLLDQPDDGPLQAGMFPSVWRKHFDELLRNDAARNSVTPYFPSVLPRLMKLLREPDCPAKAVAELVAADATLACNVLRLANGPLLRTGSQPIDSLQKATSLLGFQGMYALVAAAVMEPVILRQSRQYPRLGQRLWRHALCTGQLLQTSGDTDSAGRGTAYLAGLLHGVGAIIVCHEIQRHLAQWDMGGDDVSLFHQLISDYAASLTTRVAEDWQLPASLLAYLDTAAAEPASHRLQRASLAVKAGMLIEQRRMMPDVLDQVCASGQDDMGRRVMQLLQPR